MKQKRKTEDIDGCIMVKTALMLSSYQSIVATNQIVIFLATLHSETSLKLDISCIKYVSRFEGRGTLSGKLDNSYLQLP